MQELKELEEDLTGFTDHGTPVVSFSSAIILCVTPLKLRRTSPKLTGAEKMTGDWNLCKLQGLIPLRTPYILDSSHFALKLLFLLYFAP